MIEQVEISINFRRCFADAVYNQMRKNENIWVLTGDLGYKMWDQIKTDYPGRFINTGAAEQAMMGIGVGLALEGRIPILYSVTSFLLYRPFETIRNYMNHEQIPVKLIGSGRDRDYRHDGFSHWSQEDREIMHILSGIESRWPNSPSELPTLVEEMIKSKNPWYINLKR